jgi:antitoxin HicB
MRFVYPIDLQDDRYENGDPALLITFPDLPEAITSGKDLAEAMANAVDCLDAALGWRVKDREDIPEPSPARGRPTVAPGSLMAQKAALYLAMCQDDVRPADLARRMDVRPSQVDRLLDPMHASKPAQFDAAFRALGRRVVVDVQKVAA